MTPKKLIGVPASEDVDDADVRQRRGDVLSALDDVGEVDRRVLELAYFGGYTQAEIATITGTSLPAVKKQMLAALNAFAADLAERAAARDKRLVEAEALEPIATVDIGKRATPRT